MIVKFLQSLFDMTNQIADTQKTAIEHQAEKQIIKDKQRHKKATDIAEQIICITQKYFDTFLEKDKKDYEKLVNQFYKYN